MIAEDQRVRVIADSSAFRGDEGIVMRIVERADFPMPVIVKLDDHRLMISFEHEELEILDVE